jgi:hypothetical protein
MKRDVRVITLRDIDKKLRSDFKAACAKKGRTMKEEIVQSMLDLAAEQEKKE